MVDCSQALVVALLALALYVETGLAIRCYVCSSERDPSCKDDFLPSHHQHKLTHCSQENMRDISDLIPGIFSNFGYRSAQPEDFHCVKAKRREYGREVVVRSCTIPRADTFDVCSQLKSRDLEFCQTCHTDACNGSSHLARGWTLTLMMAVPALVAIHAASSAVFKY